MLKGSSLFVGLCESWNGAIIGLSFSLVPSMMLKVLICMGVIKFLWCGGGELVIKVENCGIFHFHDVGACR